MDAVLEELAKWVKQEGGSIQLDPDSGDAARRIIAVTVRGEQAQITIPATYPNSKEDYFFIDTDSENKSIRSACNRCMEYVFEQPPSMSLTQLMGKLNVLCNSTEKARPVASDDDDGDDDDEQRGSGSEEEEEYDSGCNSDGEYQYEDNEGGMDTEDHQESWLVEHHKKRRWQAKETEMREQMKQDRALQLQMKDSATTKKSDKVEQVFTSEASSKILTNDLLKIMRGPSGLGFSADAVDDNIYQYVGAPTPPPFCRSVSAGCVARCAPAAHPPTRTPCLLPAAASILLPTSGIALLSHGSGCISRITRECCCVLCN